MEKQLIEADLTFTGKSFESGIQIEIEGDKILRVGKGIGASPTMPLKGRALLPGFVNAHSHAFQRFCEAAEKPSRKAPAPSGPGAKPCTSWSKA